MKRIIIIASLFLPLFFMLSSWEQHSREKTIPENRRTQQPDLPGEKVFKQYCISCHQADGGGVPNMIPPLINTTYVLGDKERLIQILLKGLNQNIEIEDQYFSNPMPALNMLKDQEIADVLTFVRNSFGNKASSVTVEEVKAVRAKTK